MKKIGLLLFIFLFASCLFNDKTEIANEEVPLDESYRGGLAIEAAFPASNSTMAKNHNLSGNFYYSMKEESPPITHRIKVINPTNGGYQIAWFLSGTEMVGFNSESFTLIPSFLDSVDDVSGDYYLDVSLRNGNGTEVDRRRWIIDLLKRVDEFTEITVAANSPSNLSVLNYSKSLDKIVTFSATISDPESEGYHYKWYLDDSVIMDPGANASADAEFQMVLERYSTSLHTLTLKIRNESYKDYLTELSWGINITY